MAVQILLPIQYANLLAAIGYGAKLACHIFKKVNIYH